MSTPIDTIYAKNGQVGIGTNNPSNKLTISGTNNDNISILGLNSGNDGSVTNNGAQIAFGYNGTNTYQHFIHTRHNTNPNKGNAIDFYVCNGTQNNIVTNSTHTMTLESGKVGIGTNNPESKLHVKNGRIRVEGHDSDKSGVLELRNYNTDINYIFTEGLNQHGKIGDLVFQTASSSKHFIFDRGNVGIGTNNPGSKLHIEGDGGNSASLQIKSTNSLGAGYMYIQRNTDGKAYVLNQSSYPLILGANNSFTQLYLKEDGNVGIGTNDPERTLSVGGETTLGFKRDSKNGIWISNSHSSGNYGINPFIQGISTTFGTNNMSLNPGGGNVGIGTHNPQKKLDVNGNCEINGRIYLRSNIGGFLFGSTTHTFFGVYGGGSPSPSIFGFWRDSWKGPYFRSDTGRIGIGTNNPVCPLHVKGNIHLDISNRAYFNSGAVSDVGTGHDGDLIAIKSERDIWIAGGNLLVSSDERIKKDIEEVPDNLSLEMVRNIPCKYYKYIDESRNIKNNGKKVIGFIAQEVKEVFPLAVDLSNDFEPNEYRLLENITWEKIIDNSNNICKYKLTSDLQDVSGIKYKFYVVNDLSGNESEIDKEVIGNSDNSFTFDQSYNHIFCYGKEVDDFHTLDKQKLFALNFSATQEIDRIQQQQLIDISGNSLAIDINKNELELLKLENQELTNKVTSLETELNNLKTLVESLVNNN